MRRFRILDYLDRLTVVKETDAHFVCVCPVCGDDNLKIKRVPPYEQAYRCWSTQCASSAIQKALGYKKSPFETKSWVAPPVIKPLPVPFTGTDWGKVPSSFEPIESRIRSYQGGQKVKTTIYPYSKNQRVLRRDNLTEGSKFVFIQYLNNEFDWVCGSGKDSWPFYTRGLQVTDTQDTLLFVEGEKTAEFSKEHGLPALTLPSVAYQPSSLSTLIIRVSLRCSRITNYVFIADADNSGNKKAETFQNHCWRHGFGCKTIHMDELVEDPFPGMDLADCTTDTLDLVRPYVFSSPDC